MTETIAVSGFRCERCVTRLAAVLEGHPGLVSAHGNLLGEVRVTWDDATTTRAALVDAMRRGGFYEIPATAEYDAVHHRFTVA
ncbi:MAG: heavy-metal-associated domain-containing protein [Gaiella sp.]